jgi:hypothetical protein
VESTLGRGEVRADQVLVDLGEQGLVGIYVVENDGFDGQVSTEALERL